MFEIDKKCFGEFISMLRKEKSMTQKELASRLLVSNKAVSKWETGNSMPDITLLVPLADVLEVTVTELLECKRIEKTDSLDADRTDEIVKKVITLSEEEQDLFRMNLIGTSINNSNWKYILQVGRIWSVACIVILPLLYFGLKVFLSDAVGRTGEYVLIAIWVAGLFVPLHVVAKKYE